MRSGIYCVENGKKSSFSQKSITLNGQTVIIVKKTTETPLIQFKSKELFADQSATIGAANMGNTCFMATFLQIVLSVQPLVFISLSKNFDNVFKYPFNNNKIDGTPLNGDLTKILKKYVENVYGRSRSLIKSENKETLDLSDLLNFYKVLDPKGFKSGKLMQQDSYFFLFNMLMRLHEEMKWTYDEYVKYGDYYSENKDTRAIFENKDSTGAYVWDSKNKYSPGRNNYSPVFAYFGYFIEHYVFCDDCRSKNGNNSIKRYASITMSAGSDIEGGTAYGNINYVTCYTCTKKMLRFLLTSKYIIIENNESGFKLNNVAVPTEIKIVNKFQNKEKTYELIGVGHHGPEHFKALVKKNNIWYDYNDRNVNEYCRTDSDFIKNLKEDYKKIYFPRYVLYEEISNE